MKEQLGTGHLQKVTIAEKFAAIDDHWNPRIVGELNGQYVKLAKLRGAFDWHHHEHEDELFLVHRGSFRMELRDRTVELSPGDIFIVPRGVEHRPVADEEAEVLMFEPASTLNTGNVVSERTIRTLGRL
jgi:mannose-6-phosphate isomerase-like protein (cupin superfamily)